MPEWARRIVRWASRLAAALSLLIVIVLLIGWLWLRSGIADHDGLVESPALTAAVEILRDDQGVPHIFADNGRDAAFALGLVHAQDRLFQMEFMRRLGAGRLSEVMGAPTLPLDRFMRTLGVYRLAEAQYARLSPEHRAITDSYAAGVNHVIVELNNGWGRAPPPEFLLLRSRPEPWQPADSLIWGKLMGLMLTDNWRAELLRQEVSDRLGPNAAAVLWRGNEAEPTTLPGDRAESPRRHYTPWPYRLAGDLAATLPLDESAVSDATLPPALWAAMAEAMAATVPADLSGGASNAWVLDGGRTRLGAPILANDPHLGFSAPNLWYLAHVETPEGGWAGATVAGVPTPVLAQTRDIAWGFTTSNVDAADLYVLTLDADHPDSYVTPTGRQTFERREELIIVRDGDPERLVVRNSVMGPVISDLDEAARRLAGPGQVVSLRATFLAADDDSPDALFALGEARSVAQAMTALADFASPAQNVMLADRHGAIGFVSAGRIPLRRGGRDGLRPADGAAVGDDWFAWLPDNLRPRQVNPARGHIFNANNSVLPEDAALRLTGHNPEDGFRAARLSVLIAASREHDLETSTAWQHDRVSLLAQRLLPLLLAAQPADEDGQAVLELLRAWPADMDRDRPEPLIFYAWLRRIGPMLWGDELGDMTARFGGSHPLTVEHILTEAVGWCDDVTTADMVEDCDSRNAMALAQAVRELRNAQGRDPRDWRWGDAHQARMTHPMFTRVPLLRDMVDLSIAMSGGDATLLRASPNMLDPQRPFAAGHGAGYRAVYDLGNPARSLFSQATGQSGNPLSRHFDDQLTDWRDGHYFVLFRDRDLLLAADATRLHLLPKTTPWATLVWRPTASPR